MAQCHACLSCISSCRSHATVRRHVQERQAMMSLGTARRTAMPSWPAAYRSRRTPAPAQFGPWHARRPAASMLCRREPAAAMVRAGRIIRAQLRTPASSNRMAETPKRTHHPASRNWSRPLSSCTPRSSRSGPLAPPADARGSQPVFMWPLVRHAASAAAMVCKTESELC